MRNDFTGNIPENSPHAMTNCLQVSAICSLYKSDDCYILIQSGRNTPYLVLTNTILPYQTRWTFQKKVCCLKYISKNPAWYCG